MGAWWGTDMGLGAAQIALMGMDRVCCAFKMNSNNPAKQEIPMVRVLMGGHTDHA